MVNDLMKFITKNKVAIGVVLILLFAMSQYSNKFNLFGGMEVQANEDDSAVVVDAVKGVDTLGQHGQLGSASGLTTNNYGLPPGCAETKVVDPKDLLPRDNNSEFAKLNPAGSGDLKNVNLLKAGHHIGINTVGQSLRNANLQLRSDPAISVQNVGPWMNSTISGDPNRRHLDLA